MICSNKVITAALVAVGLFMSCSVGATMLPLTSVGHMNPGKVLKYGGKYFKIEKMDWLADRGTITLKPRFYEDMNKKVSTGTSGIKHDWINGRLKLTVPKSAYADRVFECRISSAYKKDKAEMLQQRAQRKKVRGADRNRALDKLALSIKLAATKQRPVVVLGNGHLFTGKTGIVTGRHTQGGYMVLLADNVVNGRMTRAAFRHLTIKGYADTIEIKICGGKSKNVYSDKEGDELLENLSSVRTGDCVNISAKPEGGLKRHQIMTYADWGLTAYIQMEDNEWNSKNIQIVKFHLKKM